MAQAKRREGARRRLSLSVRLSLLVLFAALVPLAAVVGINDYFARGTLVQQGRAALSTDANAKATLIEAYMRERLADGMALSSLPTAPLFLACVESGMSVAACGVQPQSSFSSSASQGNAAQLDPASACQIYLCTASISRALAVGIARDTNYSAWNMYTITGKFLLSSNPPAAQGAANGVPGVPQEDLAQVKQNKQWISAVFLDGQKRPSVHIYTPITTPGQNVQVLGFLQSTLRLDYITNIVNNEQGANGKGSYAFLADENGIRIADPHADELFTAVQPLDAGTQQLISSEQRFGGSAPVQQANLPDVQRALSSSSPEVDFAGIATPGSTASYQFVRIKMTVVPWSYFVLSPAATVTRVADDQVKLSLISAAVIAVLAILIGLFVGRRTTGPVHTSVAELQGASASLQDLAARQQASAGEQQWVVDACRTGLESVRYLSDAMNQAAHRIIDASNWFSAYWDRLSEDQARRTVQHLLELAHYIDEAARRQYASSERLDKAIGVTMQVSDQLVGGANAATQSADQLEQVVADLQRVVGGRAPATSATSATSASAGSAGELAVASQAQQMTPMTPMAPMAMPVPMRQEPRGVMAPSQIIAPQSNPRWMPASRGLPNPPSMWGRGTGAASGWGAAAPAGQMPAAYGDYGATDGYGSPESAASSGQLMQWGGGRLPAPRDPRGWDQRY